MSATTSLQGIDQIVRRASRDVWRVSGHPEQVVDLLRILAEESPPGSEVSHRAARGANWISAELARWWDEPFEVTPQDNQRMGLS